MFLAALLFGIVLFVFVMSYDLTSNVPIEICIVRIELVILTQLPVCTDCCQV